jgi:hypothetical protein
MSKANDDASHALGQFAVRATPELNDTQRQFRTNLLRMSSQLIETEFEKEMDTLTALWLEYRKPQGG